MPCRSIADILRGMGEVPPSDLRSVDRTEPQPTEIVDNSPVPPCAPWVDTSRIQASTSSDVLAAIENGRDDRSLAVKRAQAVQALTSRSRPTFIKFGAQAKVKSAPKPKPKRERTDATREYFREYQRQRRAREKAEQLSSP